METGSGGKAPGPDSCMDCTGGGSYRRRYE